VRGGMYSSNPLVITVEKPQLAAADMPYTKIFHREKPEGEDKCDKFDNFLFRLRIFLNHIKIFRKIIFYD
jgi:hypothetical protein